MRIDKAPMLLVLPWSPDLPGGVSVVVRNLTRVWEEVGISTTILVPDWNSKYAHTDERGTFKLRLAIFAQFSIAGILKGLLLSAPTLWRTLALLRKQRVDTVYFHYANLDAIGVALLKRLGLFNGRLVLCFHGTDVREQNNRIEAALWNFVFSSASAITACSNSLARGVEATYKLEPGRVVTVYNGVDTNIFSTPPKAKSSSADFFAADIGRYIVSVGSFIARKGHKDLINAFARVSRAVPDVGLVVVGMDGDQLPLLEAQIAALGIGSLVRFQVDKRPEQVAEVVAGATLCIQPSLAEPFGMAVIEAGASGVCVAASAVGGHQELISHRHTGFLFEASDLDGIESTLIEILSNDLQRAKIAEAFQAKVLSTFTWRACADSYRTAAHARRD